MHTPPAAPKFDWVLQVQHLVVEDVFDRVAGDAGVVEDAADDDGVVGGIVVSEAAAGVVLAPGKLGSAEESVKEAAVEVVEDFFEVIVMAAGRANVLASAQLADEAGFGGDVVAADVAAIAGALVAVDRFAIEFGEQDVRDGLEYSVGRALQQIGDAREQSAFAHADGVVDGDEGIETDVHRRNGRTRAKLAIGFVKDFGELRGHVERRVAEGAGAVSKTRQPSTAIFSFFSAALRILRLRRRFCDGRRRWNRRCREHRSAEIHTVGLRRAWCSPNS